MTDSEVLAVAQAADELHLSVRAVQHRIKNGQIKATKLGVGRTSAYVIARAEIDRVKAEQAEEKAAREGASA